MNHDDAAAYLLSKPEALEDYPFGPDVAVYKIRGKMFAILAVEDSVARTNLKCDPQEALALRDIFDAVLPGYHMNKKHWNTLQLDGSLPDSLVLELIRHSLDCVLGGCTKAVRERIQAELD